MAEFPSWDRFCVFVFFFIAMMSRLFQAAMPKRLQSLSLSVRGAEVRRQLARPARAGELCSACAVFVEAREQSHSSARHVLGLPSLQRVTWYCLPVSVPLGQLKTQLQIGGLVPPSLRRAGSSELTSWPLSRKVPGICWSSSFDIHLPLLPHGGKPKTLGCGRVSLQISSAPKNISHAADTCLISLPSTGCGATL